MRTSNLWVMRPFQIKTEAKAARCLGPNFVASTRVIASRPLFVALPAAYGHYPLSNERAAVAIVLCA
jgi:hypothetical protein